MADNLGLMVAAGGAAIIGFVLLSLGKDEEPGEERKEFPRSDLDEELCPDDMSPDGTVRSVNGNLVIPRCPSVADVNIQDCDYVNYLDDGTPICGHIGYETRFQEKSDSPVNKWYGPLTDFLGITTSQDPIPDRAETPEDSKLYMFSGAPVIESIGITKPAWLAGQDPDIFI